MSENSDVESEEDYTGVIFTFKGIDTDLTLLAKHDDKYHLYDISCGKFTTMNSIRNVGFVHDMFKNKVWIKVGHLDDFVSAIAEVLHEQRGD